MDNLVPSVGDISRAIKWLRQRYQNHKWKHMQETFSAVRENPDLYKFLVHLYKPVLGDNILQYKNMIFPVAVFPAPKSQRYHLESVLGKLDTTIKESIAPEFEKVGAVHIEQLKKVVKSLWNGPTYTMVKFEHKKELKLNCGLGTYFGALKSQDIFETELLLKFAKKPPNENFRKFEEKLILRNRLHRLGNVFQEPVAMSSAIAIETSIIYAHKDTYKVCLWERSKDVAVYPNLLQLIPSAMFQPTVNEFLDEFSIKRNIYREYLEEVFGVKEAQRSEGYLAYNHFDDNPNLRYLKKLEESGGAKFYFTGISINLLQLRVSVCTLLLIKDKDWFSNHGKGRKVGDLQLSKANFNYEFERRDTLDMNKYGGLSLDLTKDLVMPEHFRPENFVPPAAASLKLGIDVAREELGID